MPTFIQPIECATRNNPYEDNSRAKHIDGFVLASPKSSQLETMDKGGVSESIDEKDQRIRDLEKLVEDQKRLRIQDAKQVEEKAARIKEWVANKLKELENQNKQLREQNKKQKEVVESLNNRLASMSPLASPLRIKNHPDSVNFIDQISPVQTLDLKKSLKLRRPQLKKSFPTLSSSSEDENQSTHRVIRSRSNLSQTNQNFSSQNPSKTYNLSMYSPQHIIIPTRSYIYQGNSQASPIYDSVSADQNPHRISIQDSKIDNHNERNSSDGQQCAPPPPPIHQTERWEVELYNLVDQVQIGLVKQEDTNEESDRQIDRPDSLSKNYESISRKSSSSQKNDLVSLFRPAFTTIDGDQVVDDHADDSCPSENLNTGGINDAKFSTFNNNHDEFGRASNSRKSSIVGSCDNLERSIVSNLFESPMRSRAGRDCILRTQSVRRNPAPEKLYDFVASDLVKRGYLIKPGTLKNHVRWIVLRNFHLYTYKSESEEMNKALPVACIKLNPSCQIISVPQSNDANFPFKVQHADKSVQLIAETSHLRDEWVRILMIATVLSDLEPETLVKQKSSLESIISYTRHGHTKRSYAILVGHILFFVKSPTDPAPMSYIPVRGSRIREVTDYNDYDLEEQEDLKNKNHLQDCCLAIYPKFSLSLDPAYLTFGNQAETDRWLHHLSQVSGSNQTYGTKYEQSLTEVMMSSYSKCTNGFASSDNASSCRWLDHSEMLYSDQPISAPLTTLPNETLQGEAIELFKSLLLFTQVPIEPIAIDYHVSLLQNCLNRFLKHPELRNEFFAQLMKQCTYVQHYCVSAKSSSCSSGCSSINQRSSLGSLSPTFSECQMVTDLETLDSFKSRKKLEASSTLSQLNSLRGRLDNGIDDIVPPSKSELLQTIQVLSVAVSLNLPRGRMRSWLMSCLHKFANPNSEFGKYALYTLRATERTLQNGSRDSVPSRMEIMSILSRNPFDHSSPHSLPINFSDGSYLVIEADGSTTVEEFMTLMGDKINIRNSSLSDYYLFADDPAGSSELHILEPQRKVLDVVGWWEQIYRRNNSGKYQNTRAIKLICKKRLLFRVEEGETYQERLLIVHQVNNEVISQKIPLPGQLTVELGAVMAQLCYGDYKETDNALMAECLLSKIGEKFLPDQASKTDYGNNLVDLVTRWKNLVGKATQDCVRVYLNCIRRLKFN